MKLPALTLHEAGDLLRKRQISSRELTLALFDRIHQLDGRIHAYISVNEDSALREANRADERLKTADAAPFLGIPFAIKDNFLVRDLPATCASKILANFIAPYDATSVKKLRDAGAVFLGKTNLDEFAMGSSTENSAVGPTANPWNTDRVPGGSSGGSAAAVAADLCIAAVGTDTGGSIRQPAACCGIVGFKPTYGRISRYGIVAFASSMDQVGPMTKDVTDAALLLEVLAGFDSSDSTSSDVAVPQYVARLNGDIKGLRIGIPREYFVSGMEREVEAAVRNAIKLLANNGAVVEEISLPHTEFATAVYYIVATAEASSNLARYDGMRYGNRADARDLTETYMLTRDEGFGREVKRRIMLGTYVLSAGYFDAYYLKAQQVRTLVKRDFDAAFERCDLIVTPTAPTTAFSIGAKTEDPLQMYLSDIYTISANLAGLPALSLPCGFDSHGLPIGLQMIGKAFDESTILQAAHAYEQQAGWRDRKPELDVS